jgi:hypothetical protein
MRFVNFIPISFFRSCEASFLGTWIKHGWNFAIAETIHLLALAILLGSVLALNLHLLGFRMRQQSGAELARELKPWIWTGLSVMILTGVPLFFAESVRCGRSGQFFYKMVFLLSAVIFQLTVIRMVTNSAVNERAWLVKLAGGVSLFLWLSIAFLGRAIAFPYLLPFLRAR